MHCNACGRDHFPPSTPAEKKASGFTFLLFICPIWVIGNLLVGAFAWHQWGRVDDFNDAQGAGFVFTCIALTVSAICWTVCLHQAFSRLLVSRFE